MSDELAAGIGGRIAKLMTVPLKILDMGLTFIPGFGKVYILVKLAVPVILLLLLAGVMCIFIVCASPLRSFQFIFNPPSQTAAGGAVSESDTLLFSEINKLYDDFEKNTGLYVRDASFFDVVFLYNLMVNDKNGMGAYEKDTAVDTGILKKAFTFINGYTQVKKTVTINKNSSSASKQLGNYRISFIASASANDIKIVLPNSFSKAYSYTSEAEIRIDLINKEKNFTFINQRPLIQHDADGGSNIVYITYPQAITDSLLSQMFPNETEFPDISADVVFNDKSCALQHVADVKQAALKKYSDYTDYQNENTYEWLQVISAVYSEITCSGYFENDRLAESEISEITANDYNIDSDNEKVKTAVKFALDRVGIPYSQARRDDGSHFDCSSLVYYAYRSAGINLVYGGANTAAAEANYCAANNLVVSWKYDEKAMKPGDLIFYSMGNNGRYLNITHVAVYCGKGMVCDASYSQKKVVYRKIFSTDKIVLIGRPSGE